MITQVLLSTPEVTWIWHKVQAEVAWPYLSRSSRKVIVDAYLTRGSPTDRARAIGYQGA